MENKPKTKRRTQSDVATFYNNPSGLTELEKRRFQERLRQEFGIISPDYVEVEKQQQNRQE